MKSLARPGGNVTGFTTMSAETSGKVFEVFREVVPGLKRVAVLASRAAWELFASAQDQAAKALGIDLVYLDLPGPEATMTFATDTRARRRTTTSRKSKSPTSP